MKILKKGEKAEPLWGIGTEYITDKDIDALKSGKRLYMTVNNEYAVVIRYKGGKAERKNEHGKERI